LSSESRFYEIISDIRTSMTDNMDECVFCSDIKVPTANINLILLSTLNIISFVRRLITEWYGRSPFSLTGNNDIPVHKSRECYFVYAWVWSDEVRMNVYICGEMTFCKWMVTVVLCRSLWTSVHLLHFTIFLFLFFIFWQSFYSQIKLYFTCGILHNVT